MSESNTIQELSEKIDKLQNKYKKSKEKINKLTTDMKLLKDVLFGIELDLDNIQRTIKDSIQKSDNTGCSEWD